MTFRHALFCMEVFANRIGTEKPGGVCLKKDYLL
jgi:hypothetical protein